jgi:hypothetical protein
MPEALEPIQATRGVGYGIFISTRMYDVQADVALGLARGPQYTADRCVSAQALVEKTILAAAEFPPAVPPSYLEHVVAVVAILHNAIVITRASSENAETAGWHARSAEKP